MENIKKGLKNKNYKMTMISIICASNNKKILEKELIMSLSKQTFIDYELIIVDTNKLKFESAAEALNYGAKKAKGNYIVFAHHDIIIKESDELERIIKYVEQIEDFGIIGIAGITEKGMVIGNITNGDPEVKIANKEIANPTEVQTVDEVMFIVKKEIFDKYRLNTENKTWHLYAVEYCMQMKNIGKKVYVIPSNIYHHSSGGSMNKDYYKEIKRFSKLQKNTVKIINTTMGKWHTNRIILFFDIIKVKILLKLIKIKKRY